MWKCDILLQFVKGAVTGGDRGGMQVSDRELEYLVVQKPHKIGTMLTSE